jgi:hypothetical protein
MLSTVKENILFGSAYDEQRYCDVVRGCALALDLQTLPDGDGTEIGVSHLPAQFQPIHSIWLCCRFNCWLCPMKYHRRGE